MTVDEMEVVCARLEREVEDQRLAAQQMRKAWVDRGAEIKQLTQERDQLRSEWRIQNACIAGQHDTIQRHKDTKGHRDRLTEERDALRHLLFEASGPMSYGHWASDFRDQVELVLGRDYMGNEVELHQKLYTLATQMIVVANEIEEYGRPDKATEMRGAARMAHDWALEIREETDEKDNL